MDAFGYLSDLTRSAGGYVVPFLFLIVLVVFVHEFGHYIVGRWCGIRALTFSVGFGPELIGRTDRSGTRWCLSAIPLGGYVKFFGDSSVASTPDGRAIEDMNEAERATAFHCAPVWKRAAIVAAGPAANFLLAIVIFTSMSLFYGKQILLPRVAQVVPGSVAAMAGLRPNDLFLSINGRPIESFSEMQRIVSTSPGVPLTLVLERDGAEKTLVVTPEAKVVATPFGKQRIGMLGVGGSNDPADTRVVSMGLAASLANAFDDVWFIVERTGSYVAGLFAGTESTDQLSGPIRIAQISGQVASSGILALLSLAAGLSVSIGLINLVPVPLLDGGHLLYYAAEAVRGRPLSERVQEVGFRVGLALVLMLMLFTTVNDVFHLVAL